MMNRIFLYLIELNEGRNIIASFEKDTQEEEEKYASRETWVILGY